MQSITLSCSRYLSYYSMLLYHSELWQCFTYWRTCRNCCPDTVYIQCCVTSAQQTSCYVLLLLLLNSYSITKKKDYAVCHGTEKLQNKNICPVDFPILENLSSLGIYQRADNCSKRHHPKMLNVFTGIIKSTTLHLKSLCDGGTVAQWVKAPYHKPGDLGSSSIQGPLLTPSLSLSSTCFYHYSLYYLNKRQKSAKIYNKIHLC